MNTVSSCDQYAIHKLSLCHCAVVCYLWDFKMHHASHQYANNMLSIEIYKPSTCCQYLLMCHQYAMVPQSCLSKALSMRDQSYRNALVGL